MMPGRGMMPPGRGMPGMMRGGMPGMPPFGRPAMPNMPPVNYAPDSCPICAKPDLKVVEGSQLNPILEHIQSDHFNTYLLHNEFKKFVMGHELPKTKENTAPDKWGCPICFQALAPWTGLPMTRLEVYKHIKDNHPPSDDMKVLVWRWLHKKAIDVKEEEKAKKRTTTTIIKPEPCNNIPSGHCCSFPRVKQEVVIKVEV